MEELMMMWGLAVLADVITAYFVALVILVVF
jgi:hypothetical protein